MRRAPAGLLVNDYSTWSGAVPAAVARGLRHVMSQPLLVRDDLIGAITVARLERDAPPFADEDLAVLGLVAARVALALRNATLYEEAQARRREAEALARVARTLTGILDVATVGAQVVESVVPLFGCAAAGVGLLRPDHTLTPARRRRARGGPPAPELRRGREHRPRRPRAGDAQAGLVARRARGPRPRAGRRAPPHRGRRGPPGRARTPLRHRDRLIGVLILAFSGTRDLLRSRDSRWPRRSATRPRSPSATRALHEEAGRRRREAEVAARIARTLNSSLDLDVVLQRVVEAARELCGSDMARIALLDPASGAMVFRYWVNSRYRGYGAIRLTRGLAASAVA